MSQRDRSRGARVVSGLFLASVVLLAGASATLAWNEMEIDAQPQCYGTSYFGGYHGDVLMTELDGALGFDGFSDFSNSSDPDFVQTYVDALQFWWFWNPESQPIDIDESTIEKYPENGEVNLWTFSDGEGNEYVLDPLWGLYDSDGRVVLQRRVSGSSALTEVGEGCRAEQMNLERSSREQPSELLLFAYYDGSSSGPTFLYDSNGSTPVDGYFGRDGRFIPVCNEKVPEIQPCLAGENVYYDSGLNRSISIIFWYALLTACLAIAARLLFGGVAHLLDRNRAVPAPSALLSEDNVTTNEDNVTTNEDNVITTPE